MFGQYLITAFEWSEVWTLLIPLCVLLFRPEQPAYLKPIVVYLWLALLLNLVANVAADFKPYVPLWLKRGNNPIYNIHSLVRFACFAAFFMAMDRSAFTVMKRVLALSLAAFVLFNFLFNEDFFYYKNISGNLFTAEAYILLVYCLLYYFVQLKKEKEIIASGPDFWITTGLCIYVVINFFVFLFYVPMMKQDPQLADNMWDVHNVAYILLSLFIAKAFYVPARTLHPA